MKTPTQTFKTVLLTGCMAAALVAAPLAFSPKAFTSGMFVSQAQADDDGDGGKGKMSKGANAGSHSGKGPGTIGGTGKGQGGPSSDSDGKGPRAGMSSSGGGGKPAWAQEGIPEVELGRLNVARAPGHVLDRALEEVLLNWTDAKTTLYSMTLTDYLAALAAAMDSGTMVDSPLENLSLYKDLMIDGISSTPVQPVGNDAILTLAAIYFGGASDKTVPITTDTVKAINIILGLDVNDATVSKIATDAEVVRQAILDIHG